MYGEDMELGLRARRAGVETWLWPQARVVHHRAHAARGAFGGEPFELLARARHDAVVRAYGPPRARIDDLAQAVTFGTRIVLKRALGTAEPSRAPPAAGAARAPARRSEHVRRRRWAAAAATLVVALAALSVVLLGAGSPRQRHPRPHRRRAPAVAPAVAPALSAPAGEEFGINVNRLFNDRTDTPAQIDAQLAALEATGATVARSDALWEATEPTVPSRGVHHWVWQFDDSIAASLAAHGLTWLPILDYSAPWAQSVAGQDHSPPRVAGDYAAYAVSLRGALRRGRDVLACPSRAHRPSGDDDRDLERARQRGILGAGARRHRLRPALPGRSIGDRRRRPGGAGDRRRTDRSDGVPAGDGPAPHRTWSVTSTASPSIPMARPPW